MLSPPRATAPPRSREPDATEIGSTRRLLGERRSLLSPEGNRNVRLQPRRPVVPQASRRSILHAQPAVVLSREATQGLAGLPRDRRRRSDGRQRETTSPSAGGGSHDAAAEWPPTVRASCNSYRRARAPPDTSLRRWVGRRAAIKHVAAVGPETQERRVRLGPADRKLGEGEPSRAGASEVCPHV
jgi:hypothetical protein